MRIAIVGTGAMGRWLVQQLSPIHEVCWWDPLISPKEEPVMGTRLDSPDVLARTEPNLLINCVPLSQTIAVFERFLSILPERTILADITSIKGPLAAWYGNTGRPFLSFHPLFGPLFSPVNKQTLRTILVMSESVPEGIEWLNDTFTAPGFKIRNISFAEHDPAMRITLGMPMLLSLLGLELLPKDICPGTGLAAFMQHGQTVLLESPDLLSAVLTNTLSSDLTDQISRILGDWRLEAENGSLIDRLRRTLPQKLDHLLQRGDRRLVS